MTEEKENTALEISRNDKIAADSKVSAVKAVAVAAVGFAAIFGYVYLVMNGHNPGDNIWWLLVMAIVGITWFI